MLVAVSCCGRLVRWEEKLNALKYWDSFNENPVQSIQNSDPKHTVAYTQLCECPWVTQTQPELEPNQIFLEKPEDVRLPHPPWQRMRGEEMRRRTADTCQMMTIKACRVKQKRHEIVKVLQLNTVFSYLCNVYFILNKFTKLWPFCFCFVNMLYGV